MSCLSTLSLTKRILLQFSYTCTDPAPSQLHINDCSSLRINLSCMPQNISPADSALPKSPLGDIKCNGQEEVGGRGTTGMRQSMMKDMMGHTKRIIQQVDLGAETKETWYEEMQGQAGG
eukprot:749634-Hanusia_phi.AAC.2